MQNNNNSNNNDKSTFIFIVNKSIEMFSFFCYLRALSADMDTRFKWN